MRTRMRPCHALLKSYFLISLILSWFGKDIQDKLADLWPDYPCLYDVRCPEFKNRELRDKAFQELAEKLGTTCKIIQNFISVKNKRNKKIRLQ